jgi:protein-tyrosine phosphatase
MKNSKKKVFVFNFPIMDHDITTNENMLEMVKTLTYATSLGKAAIHCHAGKGRTCKIVSFIFQILIFVLIYNLKALL